MSDGSFEATRRRQARLGLAMTPAERLRWLEDARATMLRWRGRARFARTAPTAEAPAPDDRDASEVGTDIEQ